MAVARYAEELRYSVVAHYTRALVYERIAPGLLEELERKSPPNEKGQRPNKLHQWLTEDVGNPLWFAKTRNFSGFGDRPLRLRECGLSISGT